jgi:hypothetical protein
MPVGTAPFLATAPREALVIRRSTMVSSYGCIPRVLTPFDGLALAAASCHSGNVGRLGQLIVR